MNTSIKILGGDTGEPLNLTKRLTIITDIVQKDSVILDCGCGAGDYIPGMLLLSIHVHGLEFNQEKVNRFKVNNPGLENVVQGNIEQMPFASEMFDYVILNEVLEHVPDDSQGLREIYRVLKKGGHLIVFSPNRIYPFESHGVFWKTSQKRITHAFPFIPYVPLFLGNRIFTYWARNYFPLELRRLLAANNFTVERHFYITQTFEGIGKSNFLEPMRKILRVMFYWIERIPIVRIPFSVSQVIVVRK